MTAKQRNTILVPRSNNHGQLEMKKFYGFFEGITKEGIMDLAHDHHLAETGTSLPFSIQNVSDSDAQRVADELSEVDAEHQEDENDLRDEVIANFIKRIEQKWLIK